MWLRHALAGGDALEVHYQPIVSLDDGRMVGVEALVRGFSPSRGRLAPEEFLGVAEETGMITALDFWVLRTACTQLARWHRRGGAAAALTVSVNMSARHFERIGVSGEVSSVIRSIGIDPSSVQLEITEGTMVQSLRQASVALQQLRSLGVRVAIDDFGTGYSSLNHLSKLPIDALKIDASFVARAGASEQDNAIVRLILALAGAMDVAAVAEGIEDARQAQLLAELGCPQGQGYYFARPMPAEDIDVLLDACDAGLPLPIAVVDGPTLARAA